MSQNPRVKSDLDYLYHKILTLPKEKVTSNIVETAERIRVFPPGSPFPGKHKYSKTPYMVEPAMELSPQSDTVEVVICKGGQLGATAGSTEPLILFKIDQDPGPVLAITANDELAKTWNDDRIDPMLQHSGVIKKLKNKIDKNSQHGGGGNTALKKTWDGGRLDIKTYGKVSQIRQISYQIVILEEEEEAEAALKARGAKQGKFRDIAYGRTRAFKGRRKILRISTPLIKETSAIWQAFESGDQRYFYIPCPNCGHLQRLEWKHLKYKTNEFKIVDPESVYYECQGENCDYHIKNEQKTEILKTKEYGGTAEWRPHNKQHGRPGVKSYQFSALYAPIGLDDWTDLAQMWVDAQTDPEKLQVFWNLNLGLPFEDRGEAPPAETLHILKGKYQRGTRPDPETEGMPLFTMLGCDIQAGEKRGGEYLNGKEPRIEASLVAFGLNDRIWLLDHYVIRGAVTDYRSGAFKDLRRKIIKQDFPIMPEKIFIDARHQTDEVKKFCNRSNKVFPIMGVYSLKEKATFQKIPLQEFVSADGGPLPLYELRTNPIKRQIYNKIVLRRDPLTGDYPDGYMMFPIDILHRYFEQLTAERPIIKTQPSGRTSIIWDAGGRANESLDCMCYAIMAKEIYMHEMCLYWGFESTDRRSFWIRASRKYAHMLAG
ncbi:phage terminase large subunit family protein [Candidatus Pacearchaeota archaeon]|nr:phage terminase large subunit family protein [Candidatus Pacearchaeota archaeon]